MDPPVKCLLQQGPSPRGCLGEALCCGYSSAQAHSSPQDTLAQSHAPQLCHWAYAEQGVRVHPTLQLHQGHHIPPASIRVVPREAGCCTPRCCHNAVVMLGKYLSLRGSCWCQAWAAALPGLDANCICLRMAPKEWQHQGGVRGVGSSEGPSDFTAFQPSLAWHLCSEGQGLPG